MISKKRKPVNKKVAITIVTCLVATAVLVTAALSVKRAIIISEAKNGRSQIGYLLDECKEKDWYLDDYDRAEVFELAEQLGYIQTGTTLFNLTRNAFWVEMLYFKVRNLDARIRHRMDLLGELRNAPHLVSREVYDAKIEEARFKDREWLSGGMMGGWYIGNDMNASVPTVLMRGYVLVDNVLVPCSFEKMTKFLYSVDEATSLDDNGEGAEVAACDS